MIQRHLAGVRSVMAPPGYDRAPYRGEVLTIVAPMAVNAGEAVVFLGRLPVNEQ